MPWRMEKFRHYLTQLPKQWENSLLYVLLFNLLMVFHLLANSVDKTPGIRSHRHRGIPGCLEKKTEAGRKKCSMARSIANLPSPHSHILLSHFFSFSFILFFLPLSFFPPYFSSSLSLAIYYILLFHLAKFSLIKISSLIEKCFHFQPTKLKNKKRNTIN